MKWLGFKKKEKKDGEAIAKEAAPPFKKALFFGRKGLPKKEDRLVLEVGEEWIKLLGVSRKGGKTRITLAEAESIKGENETEIAQKVVRFLRLKAFKPKHIVISHPTHQLTTRILNLPSTDPREIQDILELQAVKQTPYTKEEITTGFRMLGSDATGYSTVLLAIAHRDAATRYFRIVETAGRAADHMTVSIEGLRLWFEQFRAEEDKKENRITLLLSVDWMTTDFIIFNRGRLAFSRSLSVGAKNFVERKENTEAEFLKELQLSVESGNPELKGEALTHVLLTGVPGPLKDLTALVSRELNLPCEITMPAEKMEAAIDASVLDVLESANCSFAHLVGLALAPESASINLIPHDIQMRKGLEERAKDLAMMGTLFLALVTVFSAVGFMKVYQKNTYLEDLREDYNVVQDEALGVERLVAKMKAAREQLDAQGRVLEIIRDINEVIPDNITLTYFQFQAKDHVVTVRGISEEMSAVFQFLSTLEATPLLESVKTRNVTRRKIKDLDVAEFEMVANVIGGGP